MVDYLVDASFTITLTNIDDIVVSLLVNTSVVRIIKVFRKSRYIIELIRDQNYNKVPEIKQNCICVYLDKYKLNSEHPLTF